MRAEPAVGERFFLTCPRGLEAALVDEITEIGALHAAEHPGGVSCEGPFDLCYRLNLRSRLAGRMLWQVASGPCRDEAALYRLVRGLPWADWFSPRHTIKVSVSSPRRSPMNVEFATLRVKDGICDRLRDMAKRRPSVDTANPDIRIVVHVVDAAATVYLDTSGESLFKRGWRQAAGEAPLRENLAAGLLRLARWNPAEPLLDPMCGSGTILIEAAHVARRRPPGLGRPFGFERLRRFDAAVWARLCEEARGEMIDAPAMIHGADQDAAALRAAQANLDALGLSGVVRLAQRDALDIEPPASSGVLIANPPYGVRTGTREALADFYPRWGDVLKRRFAGWRAYVLTADARLVKLIGLAPSRRTPLYNGPLECRCYEFKLVAGGFRRPAVARSEVAGAPLRRERKDT